jgi:formamidopyrimidine-DNA glycosylase
LWLLARKLLAIGVQTNRIITVQSSTVATKLKAGRKVNRREALYVYKRRHCRVCERAIVESTNATRTMYHCPQCQPAVRP